MEDAEIIDLYWQRNETAIAQTEAAYGRKLYGLSYRIIRRYDDAQDCVSDTYLKAWNTIPPQRPVYFFAYLAKICRFLSFDRLDWLNASKRSADIVQLTSEMELCIPDECRERQMEGKELGRLLNEFLQTLPREIAQRYGIGESKVKTQLHRIRNKLRGFLEKEGIRV